MRIIYEADDGTQFYNEYECEEYEFKISLEHLNEIKIYDKDNKELFNLFEQDTYNYLEKIIIPSNEAYEDLLKVAEYCGWCDLEKISGPGIWAENPDYSGFFNQTQWLKLE